MSRGVDVEMTFWGTRGSLPSAGLDTIRYGGNTSCVEVRTRGGGLVVLDAGSGLRLLGDSIEPDIDRIDILLSHLHLDHIMGLGFFEPLFRADLEVHIWGPSSPTMDLHARLRRLLNPPLFPVRIAELPSRPLLHDINHGTLEVPGLDVVAAPVIHPGPTLGYRLTDGDGTLAYLPDHEPALGAAGFPITPEWTSGYELAVGADVLVHDAQYAPAEYPERVGWGHSSIEQAIAFAELVEVGRFVAFHHDPSHSDDDLDRLWSVAEWDRRPGLPVGVAREGERLSVA